MSALETVVIVGASLAGIRCAEALRRQGFDGRLVLVGDEPHRPYDRPPLSKEVLRGERAPEQLALVKPESFDALRLELHLGQRATALDLAARRVRLESGAELAYDGLVIATGARARALPGAPPLAGIHVLRTLDDALAIRAELEARPRVAVVGAGFIGAEVAATCRQRGLDVTLIEALPHPMARVLNREVGMLCAAAHRDAGVDVRLGVGVQALEGGARVERVRLKDGSAVAADLVVVGIGAIPETHWLETSGLALGDGVLCDASLAAAPDVVAAGDVARWQHPGYGERSASSTGPTRSSRRTPPRNACSGVRSTRRLSPPCPSCGRISTSSRSRRPARSTPTTRCSSDMARWPSAASSPTSDATAASPARSR